MKLSTVFKFLLMIIFVVFSGGQAFSGIVPIPVTFDNITKVEQRHNPGVDPNYIELIIEGKSAGKPLSASISVISPGSGGQNIFQSCEKDAMLAFHYPEKYRFEIVSASSASEGWLKLNVAGTVSDYVFCSLNAKTNSLAVPLSQPPNTLQISN